MAPVSDSNTGLLEDIFSLVARDLEVDFWEAKVKGQKRPVETIVEDDLIPTTVLEKEAAAPAVSSAMILFLVTVQRRKIRLIECKAKCRYLKKLTCKGTLRQVFTLPEASSPPMTPYSSPYTLLYSILIHTGKGGGRAN
jgi:hypothetical protein